MCRGKTLGSPFSVSIESPICYEPRHCATIASLPAKRLHGRFHNRHNANGTIAINQPFQTIRRPQGKALSDGSRDHGLPARSDRASQLPISELQSSFDVIHPRGLMGPWKSLELQVQSRSCAGPLRSSRCDNTAKSSTEHGSCPSKTAR